MVVYTEVYIFSACDTVLLFMCLLLHKPIIKDKVTLFHNDFLVCLK